MAQMDATRPEAPPLGIDWNNLLQLFGQLLPMLLPLIQSLIKKSQFATAHGQADPLQSFLKFVDDYAAVHKAMSVVPG